MLINTLSTPHLVQVYKQNTMANSYSDERLEELEKMMKVAIQIVENMKNEDDCLCKFQDIRDLATTLQILLVVMLLSCVFVMFGIVCGKSYKKRTIRF